MKRTILTGVLAIAISIPCWAGYPGDWSDQAGQSSQSGQSGQSSQSGQSGQCGQEDPWGNPGQSGQSGQSSQAGQYGQTGGGVCEQPPLEPVFDPAKLQAVISLLSMIESDLAMCAAGSGRWADNLMAIGHINSARSALERAPMEPAWRPLLAEIHERLGRIRFHLLMNDDMNARMMMAEVQAVVRSTMQVLLINAGNGGVIRPPSSTTQQPRVVVIPRIPTTGGSYGSNSNSGSGWGSSWGSGWASGWGNGGTQLPPGTMLPTGPQYPPLPPTN